MYGVNRSGEKGAFYGKHHNRETIEKIRVNRRGKCTGENNPMYGKPSAHSTGGWFELPNKERIWLRSSYESRIATVLTNMNIAWNYEPKAFPIELNNKQATYTPDFYLPDFDIWIEVKGWWRGDAKAKFDQFSTQYPEERSKLVIMYKEDIIKLEHACIEPTGLNSL